MWSSSSKNEHILIWNEDSPCRVYLVEKTEHVSQHVGNWHIQELRKVLQVQLLALQLPGSVSVLLQNFLCVLRLEPGTMRTDDKEMNDVQNSFRTKAQTE